MSDAGDTAAGGMQTGTEESVGNTFLKNVANTTEEPVIPIPEDDAIPDSLIDVPSGPVDGTSAPSGAISEPDAPSGPVGEIEIPGNNIDDFLAAAAAAADTTSSGPEPPLETPAASGPVAVPATAEEDEYLVAPLPSEEEAAVQKEVADYFATASGASGPSGASGAEASGASDPATAQQPEPPAENALPPFETNYQRFAEGLVNPELLQAFAAKNQQRTQAAGAIDLVKEDIEEQNQVLADAQLLATAEKERLMELEGIATAASDTLKGLKANANSKRERLADFDEEQTKIDIAKEQLETLKTAEEKVRVEYDDASQQVTDTTAVLNERQASLKTLSNFLNALQLDEQRMAALQAELDRQAGLETAAKEAIQNKETAISMASNDAEEAERVKREMESKVEAMEAEETTLASMDAAVKALQTRLTELEGDKGAKEGELAKATAAADQAKMTFDMAEQKDGALKDRLGEQKVLEELIAVLSGENKKAADILKKRTNNIGSATTAVKDLEAAATAAEARIETMEQDMAAAATKEGERNGLEEAIQALRSAISTLEEEIRVAKEEEAAAAAADSEAAAAVKKREDLEKAEGVAITAASEADLAVTTKKGEISGKKAEIIGLKATTDAASAALKVTTDTIETLDKLMKELKDFQDEKGQLDKDIPSLNTTIAEQRIQVTRKKKLYDIDNAYFTAIQAEYLAIKKQYDDYITLLGVTTTTQTQIATALTTFRTAISTFLTKRQNEMTFMQQLEIIKASVGVVDGLDAGTCPKARYVRIYSVSGGESTMHMSKIAVYSKSGDNLAPSSKITSSGTYTAGNTRGAPSPASLASFINGNMRQLHANASTTDPFVTGYWKTSGYVELEFDREEEISHIVLTTTIDGILIMNGIKIELRNGANAATVVNTTITSNSARIQCLSYGSLTAGGAVAIRNRELMKQNYVPDAAVCTPQKAWSIKILSSNTSVNLSNAADGKIQFSQIEAYGPDGVNLIQNIPAASLSSSATVTGNTLAVATTGNSPYARMTGTGTSFETTGTDRNQWCQINFGKEVNITNVVRIANHYGNDSYDIRGVISATATVERRRLVGQRLQLLAQNGTAIKEYTFRTADNYEAIYTCTEDYTAAALKAQADALVTEARNNMNDYINVLKMGLGLDEKSCKTVTANRLRIRPALTNGDGQIELSQVMVFDKTGTNIFAGGLTPGGVHPIYAVGGNNFNGGAAAILFDGKPTGPRTTAPVVMSGPIPSVSATAGGGFITASADRNLHFQIDFGKAIDVAYVVLFGVQGTGMPARMNGLRLELVQTVTSGTTVTETRIIPSITSTNALIQLVPFCTDVVEAQFKASLAPLKTLVGHPAAGSPCTATRARYVRVFLPATGGTFITASQIAIYDGQENNLMLDPAVVIKGFTIPVTSGTYPPYLTSSGLTSSAQFAGYGDPQIVLRDGIYIPKWDNASRYKSLTSASQHIFLEIDLGAEKGVSHIAHVNTTENIAITGTRYLLFDKDYKYILEKTLAGAGPTHLITFCDEASKNRDQQILSGAAVKDMIDTVKTNIGLPATGTPIKTRFVRIYTPVANFEITQIIIFNPDGVNIAKFRPVSYVTNANAVSTVSMIQAAQTQRLVDGFYARRVGGEGFVMNGTVGTSYLEVDLGSIQDVAYMVVMYASGIANASQVSCEFRAYRGLSAEYKYTIPVETPSTNRVSNISTSDFGVAAGTSVAAGTRVTRLASISGINYIMPVLKSKETVSTTSQSVQLIYTSYPFMYGVALYQEKLSAADQATYTKNLADNTRTFQALTTMKTAAGVKEDLAGVTGVTRIRLRPSLISGDGRVSFTNVMVFDGLGNNIASTIVNTTIVATPVVTAPTGRTGLTGSLDPLTGAANVYATIGGITDAPVAAPTATANNTRYSAYYDIMMAATEVRYIVVVGETGQEARMYGLRVELLNGSNVVIGRNVMLGNGAVAQALSFAAVDNLLDNARYNAALGPLVRDAIFTRDGVDTRSYNGVKGVAKVRLSSTKASVFSVSGLHVYNEKGENVLLNAASTPTKVGAELFGGAGLVYTVDSKVNFGNSIAGGMGRAITAWQNLNCTATWGKPSGQQYYNWIPQAGCSPTHWFEDGNLIQPGRGPADAVPWSSTSTSPTWGTKIIRGQNAVYTPTNIPVNYDPWTITDGSVEPYSLAATRHGYVSTGLITDYIEFTLKQVSEVRGILYFNRLDGSWAAANDIKIELFDSAGKVITFNDVDNSTGQFTSKTFKQLPKGPTVGTAATGYFVSGVGFATSRMTATVGGARAARTSHRTSRKARDRKAQEGGGALLKSYVAALPADRLALNTRYTSFVDTTPIQIQDTQQNLVNRTIRYVNDLKTVNDGSFKEYTDIAGQLDASIVSLATKTARKSELDTTLIPGKQGEVNTTLAGKKYADWTAKKGADQNALTTASGAQTTAEGQLKKMEEVDLPALEATAATKQETLTAAAAAAAAEPPMETLKATATTAAAALGTATKKVQDLETEKGVQDGLLTQKEGELTTAKTLLEGLEKKIKDSYAEGEEAVRAAAAEARALASAAVTTLSALQSNAGNVDAAAEMAAAAAGEKEKELEALKKAIADEFGSDLAAIGAALDEARGALASAESAKKLAEEGLAAAVTAAGAAQGELAAAEEDLLKKQTAFREAYGEDTAAVKKARDAAIEQFTKAFEQKGFLEGEIPGLRAALEKIEADIEKTTESVNELLKSIQESYSANVGGFKEQIGVAETEIAEAIENKKGADDAFVLAKADLETIERAREKAATELLNAITALQVSFGERGGLNSAAGAAALKVEAAEVELAAAEEAVKTQQVVYGAAAARVEQEEVRLAELRFDLAKATAAAGVLEKEYRVLRSRLQAEELTAKADALAEINARELEIKNEANQQLSEMSAAAADAAAEAAEAAEIAAAAEAAEEAGLIGTAAIEEATEQLEKEAADAAAELAAHEAEVADSIAAEVDRMETAAEEAAMAAEAAEAEVIALKEAGGPEAEAELALAEAEAEELKRVAEEAAATVDAREAELTAAAEDETAQLTAAAEEAAAEAAAAKAAENAAAEEELAAEAAAANALAEQSAADKAVENAKIALNAKEAEVEAAAEGAVDEMEVAAEDAGRKAAAAAAMAAEAAEIAAMAVPENAAEASAAAAAAAAEADDLKRLADEAIQAVNAKEEELAADSAAELQAAQEALKEAEEAAAAAGAANTMSASSAAAEAQRLEEEATKALAAEDAAVDAVQEQEEVMMGINASGAEAADEAVRQNISNSAAAGVAAIAEIAEQEAALEVERAEAEEEIKAAGANVEMAVKNAANMEAAVVAEKEALNAGVPSGPTNIGANISNAQVETPLNIETPPEVPVASGPSEINVLEMGIAANAEASAAAIIKATAEEAAGAEAGAAAEANTVADIRSAQEELNKAIERLNETEAAVAAAEVAVASGPVLPNAIDGANAEKALEDAIATQKEAEAAVVEAEKKVKEIENPQLAAAVATGLAQSLETERAAATAAATVIQKEEEAKQKVEQAVTLFSVAEDTRAKEVQQAFKGFGERVKELRGLLKMWKMKK